MGSKQAKMIRSSGDDQQPCWGWGCWSSEPTGSQGFRAPPIARKWVSMRREGTLRAVASEVRFLAEAQGGVAVWRRSGPTDHIGGSTPPIMLAPSGVRRAHGEKAYLLVRGVTPNSTTAVCPIILLGAKSPRG